MTIKRLKFETDLILPKRKFRKLLFGFLIQSRLVLLTGGFVVISIIFAIAIFFYDWTVEDKKDEVIIIASIVSEETIVSSWIKKTNKSVPIEVANIIAIEACKQTSNTNLPLPLIVAIIQRESHFDPYAVSKSNAMGLMQILNGGKGIIIDQSRAFDISYNIAKGIEIFNEHLRLQKGSLDKALFGYVGGDKTYAADIYKIMGEFSMFELSYKTSEIKADTNNLRK